MQRILFVDHTPFAGGGQLVLASHIAALDHRQWEVHVACTHAVPELVQQFEQAGAVVHLLNMPRLRGFGPMALIDAAKVVRQLRQIIRNHQFDVVVTNTTRASYLATIAVMGMSVPLIWWVRDYLYPKALFQLLRWRVAAIFCVSQSIKDWYMSADDAKGKIMYVASDIDQQLTGVTAEEIQSERDRYGYGPDDLVVGFIGRLVEEKGAQDVVEAVGGLGQDNPELKLLVVGTGKDQMHDIEALLHQRVEQAGWSTTMAFAGYQTNQPLYYSLIDIFVLATRDQEPYATSVIQAMMAGKPVIGTRAGGTPEQIHDGQSGLLYQPGDVMGLQAALRQLIEDPGLRQRLADTGRTQVLQYNREDQLARRAETEYLSVMRRGS